MTYRNVKYITNGVNYVNNNVLYKNTSANINTNNEHSQLYLNRSNALNNIIKSKIDENAFKHVVQKPTLQQQSITHNINHNVGSSLNMLYNEKTNKKKEINENIKKKIKKNILDEKLINNFINQIISIYDKLISYIDEDYIDEKEKIILFSENHDNYKKIIHIQMVLQHECHFLMNVINTQIIDDDSFIYKLQPVISRLIDIINKKPLTQYLLESYGNLNNIHNINRGDTKKEYVDLYNASVESINLHLWCMV